MKPNKLFVILCITLLFLTSFSESNAQIIEGDVTLTSQAEVDSFMGTSITGSLTIGITDYYDGSSDIDDLTPLSSLTSVGVILNISNNPFLTNLDGLSNISSVSYLFIEDNDALKNLDGLSSITTVDKSMIIRHNALLTNLDAFSNITSVYGLIIGYNPLLTNLDGLSNITSVSGSLYIVGNDAITNLDGLSNIISVVSLTISSNPLLTDLDALSNITSLDGDLHISNNSLLTNLDAFSNLTSVGGDLAIGSNEALNNLDGLSNITSVYGLIIGYNPLLTNLDGLSNITSVGAFLSIEGNSELANLDGLSNLTSVGRDLYISYNLSLNSFCGIYPLLSSNGLRGYYFESNNLVNPTQYEIIDGGACITTAIAEEHINTTNDHKLLQNYPNPFHQETQIKFNISGQEKVKLNVYDMSGKEVAIIVNESLNAGEYNVLFSAIDFPAGVYYYQLRAGEFLDTKKFIIQ